MVSNSTASLHLMSARAHSIFICGDGSFEDGVRFPFSFADDTSKIVLDSGGNHNRSVSSIIFSLTHVSLSSKPLL